MMTEAERALVPQLGEVGYQQNQGKWDQSDAAGDPQ